ncbi:MAG: alpha-2-macroglobulin family protein [Acidobacteria bacterium]|nr:alpha-2-macroglobulin family protein [Acidobacteriota bacterium]
MSTLAALFSLIRGHGIRIAATFRGLAIRRMPSMRDPKNLTILLLALLVFVLGGAWIAEHASNWISSDREQLAGEPVSVLDVVLDRRQLSSLDIIFDRALGEGQLGEILLPDPAVIKPDVRGVWRWRTTNVLRFSPTDSFSIATRYRIELSVRRLLRPNQVFNGETHFSIVTNQFVVRELAVNEEPLTDPLRHVALRGRVRFNYPVVPEELAKYFRLSDPLKGDGNPVAITLEATYASRVIEFRSAPVAKQKDEREVTLRISSDLKPRRGNVSLTSDFIRTVPIGSSENLSLRSLSAVPGREGSVINLRFSSPVEPDIARKYLEVSPAVDYRISSSHNELSLSGEFRPGMVYELSVSQGLPAIDDAVLAEGRIETLRFADLEPFVDFKHQGEFLSASGYRTVAVQSTNLDRAELTVDRVYRNNLFALFSFESYLYRHGRRSRSGITRGLGDRIATKTLRLGGPRNELISTPVQLDGYVRTEAPGLYRIGLFPPGKYRGAYRWLLITDLGVVAKRSGNEYLVWVSSFADLSPISRARVDLVSDQQQILASGYTDTNGMWRSRNLQEKLAKQKPYMLTVSRGSDYSFLLLDRHAISTAGLDVSGVPPARAGYQAFLYGERDIYRPGETLKGLAIIRDKRLRVPESMPVLIRHRDPQGRERSLSRLKTTSDGLAEFSLEIPAYARTGHHKVELEIAASVVGNYRFQVEEFVPDRIKVDVSTEKEEFAADEAVRCKVAGAYLFGAPARDLAVENRVFLRPTVFASQQYPDYVFHNPSRSLEPRELYSAQDRLDESGIRTFSFKLPPGLKVPSSLEAVITARVQEQGGRGVTALKRVGVHPYPYYVGLRKTEDSHAEPGRSVRLEYVALDPQGNPVPSGDLRVEFFRDRWHTVLRETSSGNFRYESTLEPVLVTTRNLAEGNTRGSFTVVPPDYGNYRVVVTDSESGASSEVEFYASGWGYSPWAIKNPARLELDLDRKEYPLGTNAIVQVRAPFPGKLWLTVERDQVYYSRVFDLTGNTARISVPIRSEYRPNVYVTATLVRSARDLPAGQPGRAFGAVPLYVDIERNRLAVTVTASDETRPNTTLEVEVRTRRGATVTVAAVDEGILQLVNQKTADPFSFFYSKLALGVQSYDIFSLLMPESRPIEGKSDPGGGAALDRLTQFVRTEGIRRAKPVAFWSGILRTDSRGRAVAKFDVPEFQGAVRIMAVAHTVGRFGSAQHFTRVRNPLVLLPTFPRFLSFQEEVRVPVTVRNDTGRPGDFKISLAAEGPVSQTGVTARTVRINDDSEQTVYFDLKSGEHVGDVHLNLRVAGNGESTATSAVLQVRPDLPDRTWMRTGAITDASTLLPTEDTAAFRPGSVESRLQISPLPLTQYSGHLRRLLRYPYGCLEQVTSRAFPLIYFGSLAKELDPELFGNSNPEELIRSGIRRIGSMQLQQGGFSLWPGSSTFHSWASIYATHFLVEAHRAGHHVETYLYEGALRFLGNDLKARASYDAEEIERTVYALYVLARSGQADLGTMDYVRERHGAKLRPKSRALLGAAYAAVGNRQVLNDMVQGLDDVRKIERQTGRNLNSTIRNRAFLLLAFLDASPGDPRIPRLVQSLSRDALTQGRWNTQESGMALMALGQFFRRQQETPPFSGRVFAGDRQVGTFTKESKLFSELPVDATIRIEMDSGYQPGSAFYFLSVRGTPTDAAFSPHSEGLEIKRAFYARDGAPLDLNRVQQGDLIVARTEVRSLQGTLENVVVQSLLPSGLEVENPRLDTSEKLPWMSGETLKLAHQDFRDDRILVFTDLPPYQWQTVYSLLRAVTPGRFRLPPVQAEAMYDETLRATGHRGTIGIEVPR